MQRTICPEHSLIILSTIYTFPDYDTTICYHLFVVCGLCGCLICCTLAYDKTGHCEEGIACGFFAHVATLFEVICEIYKNKCISEVLFRSDRVYDD